jgi:hypothetical protein
MIELLMALFVYRDSSPAFLLDFTGSARLQSNIPIGGVIAHHDLIRGERSYHSESYTEFEIGFSLLSFM